MKKQILLRSLNTVFAVTLPLVACLACAPSANHGASFDPNGASIVKGQTVKAADPLAKMVVALLMEDDQGEALCTGSIIANDTILTAAHCLDHKPTHVTVIFSSHIKTANATDERVASGFVQNPAWTSQVDSLGDLALVHFSGGLPAGFTVVPLASADFKIASGQAVLMAGYGVTNGLTHAGPGVLRQTQTTVAQMQSPTQVISDSRAGGVCFGDSGGPAFAQSGSSVVQWGVASAVTSDNCKSTAVHTSIMSYLEWIAKATQSLR